MNVFIVLFWCVGELLLQNAFHEVWSDLASKLLSIVLKLTELIWEVLAYHSQRPLFNLIFFALNFALSIDDILQIPIFHLQVRHRISIRPNICLQHRNLISQLLFLRIRLRYNIFILLGLLVKLLHYLLAILIFILPILVLLILELIQALICTAFL